MGRIFHFCSQHTKSQTEDDFLNFGWRQVHSWWPWPRSRCRTRTQTRPRPRIRIRMCDCRVINAMQISKVTAESRAPVSGFWPPDRSTRCLLCHSGRASTLTRTEAATKAPSQPVEVSTVPRRHMPCRTQSTQSGERYDGHGLLATHLPMLAHSPLPHPLPLVAVAVAVAATGLNSSFACRGICVFVYASESRDTRNQTTRT